MADSRSAGRSYDASRRRYCARLYRLGFKRRDDGADPIVFEKAIAPNKLEVHLWRVSYSFVDLVTFSPEGGWQHLRDAAGEFSTVAGMEAAIKSKMPTPQGGA